MNRLKPKNGYRGIAPLAVLASMLGPWQASADEVPPTAAGIPSLIPIADIRLRYEEVGQVPLQDDAQSVTLRARLGFQTSTYWDTSILAEGNFLVPLDDRYRPDPAVVRPAQYPVVADPRDHSLNRVEVVNTSIPGTTVTFGRQRILLDDQRFVGNSSWRQDEQTFDALRAVNTSISGLTVDLTYSDRVHRVFTDDSPQGTYRGSVVLGNLGYKTSLGKLTGFVYLVSFDPLTEFPGLSVAAAAALNPTLTSTGTYGGRFAGSQSYGSVKLGYVASYATQTERGRNPYVFRNQYYLGEIAATVGRASLTLGDEVMQGNGTIGFATPLATTHAFDGWADKFLTTPANGLENRYVSAAYRWAKLGEFADLVTKIVYRSFAPEHVDGSYGSEWDMQLSARWGKFSPALVWADYRSAASTPAAIARDTRKVILQVDFSL